MPNKLIDPTRVIHCKPFFFLLFCQIVKDQREREKKMRTIVRKAFFFNFLTRSVAAVDDNDGDNGGGAFLRFCRIKTFGIHRRNKSSSKLQPTHEFPVFVFPFIKQ